MTEFRDVQCPECGRRGTTDDFEYLEDFREEWDDDNEWWKTELGPDNKLLCLGCNSIFPYEDLVWHEPGGQLRMF